MAEANEAQSAFWEARASDWLAAERHTELVVTPFGLATIDRLGLQPGQRVLDVGCGSGSTTIELARRVGADGAAVGLDIAPAMIAAAPDRAAAAGVGNATFRAADAQVEDLGEAFDAAHSRFGVMFFDDPTAAFTNIRRALRAGGVLAFTCWHNIFDNEWMLVPGAAVATVTGELPRMPEPGEPGPFSLEDPDHVKALLSAAGFTEIEVTTQAEIVVVPEAELDSLVSLAQRVGPVREALGTADAETQTRIKEAVRDAVFARVEDGEARLRASALVVSARA